HVGLVRNEDRRKAGDHLSQSFGRRATGDAEPHVWLRNVQLAEEASGECIVVMLSCMDQHGTCLTLAQLLQDWRYLDEVRPGTNDEDDLHGATSPLGTRASWVRRDPVVLQAVGGHRESTGRRRVADSDSLRVNRSECPTFRAARLSAVAE